MSEKTRYLLCPPDHFRVEYSINPWMGGEVDVQIAMTEWLPIPISPTWFSPRTREPSKTAPW